MLKVGVVGRHFGEKVHVPALQLAGGCEVVGVVSREYKRFIEDPSIDALTLAVPPLAQAEIAAQAFQRNKHVLLEKPVAANLRMAQKLTEIAERASVLAMVDFELPLLKTWTAAKKRIDDNELGRLKKVEITWTTMSYSEGRYENWWKHDADRGGGMLNNFGPHVFNYLEHFLGRVALLSCERDFVTHAGGLRVDIAVRMRLRTKDAVPIEVRLDGRGPAPQHRIEIKGEADDLVLENKSTDYVKGFAGEDNAAEFPDGRIWAVHLVMKRFLEAIRTGKKPHPSLQDGERTEELLEEARCS